MNGGTSKAFLYMSHVLNDAIEEDLKKNVIARWHDESHLNRYIIDRKDCRLLSPEYCYPYGLKVSYKPKLAAVGKQDKFDVNKFKGNYTVKSKPLLYRAVKYGLSLININVLYLRDSVFNKKIHEYNKL